MDESGSNSEHMTSFLKVAAWTWAGENRKILSQIEIGQPIEIVQARGPIGRGIPAAQISNRKQQIDEVLADLKEDSPEKRKSAARMVEESAEWLTKTSLLPGAIEALMEAMFDPDWSVRAQAIQALGKTGPQLSEGSLREQVIDRLKTALFDEQGLVRAIAARALDNFHWQPGKDEAAASYWTIKRVWQMCVAIGEPAVCPLCQALHDWDWTVRRGAAEALGRIGKMGIDSLIPVLQDDIPSVAEAAATSLGRIGDLGAVRPLIRNLDRLGNTGARALAQIAERVERDDILPHFVHPLSEGLKAENPFLRSAAATALGLIGARGFSNDAQEVAADILANSLQDPDWVVRCQSLHGLGLVGTHTVTDRLRESIALTVLNGAKDPFEEVRRTAVVEMNKIAGRIRSPELRHQLAQEIRNVLTDPDDELWGVVDDLIAATK